MKITKLQLRRIIKEEKAKLSEIDFAGREMFELEAGERARASRPSE